MPAARLALAAALLALATPALADEGEAPHAETWNVQVGAGVLASPQWQGSSDHRTRALPYVAVNYRGLVTASVQDGLAVNLVRAGDFVAGPSARFRFGQDEDDSAGLQGLGDVDASVELGGFVGWRRGPLSLRLSGGQDLAGGHRGAVFELSGAVGAPVARTAAGPVLLAAGPSVTLVTAKVNRAYFGVDPAQSAASGLPLYSPSGGVQQAGVSATLVVPVAPRVAVAGFAGYGRLLGAAADSPRVRLRGSPDQFTAGLFVTYRLF